jgi:hypothetical protein
MQRSTAGEMLHIAHFLALQPTVEVSFWVRQQVNILGDCHSAKIFGRVTPHLGKRSDGGTNQFGREKARL